MIIADIQGSTDAIAQGRYKDVNTIGAACIVAAQNLLGREQFPFVFGGDGATLVVPGTKLAIVRSALDGVAAVARANFGLSLRIGAVQVATLTTNDCTLEVAKYRLIGKQVIALFRGGAIDSAESLVKHRHMQDGPLDKATVPVDPLALEGLSCRWQPIPSLHGSIATILIKAIGRDRNAVYARVIASIEAILNGDAHSASPLHDTNMRYRGVFDLWRDEWRYAVCHTTWPFILRMLEIVAVVVVFKWRIPPLLFSPKAYGASLGAHSDFRKFDDMLRMVIDVTPAQVTALRDLLESLRSHGQIRFGLHESPSALMTCFVYGLGDGEHLHFVDGGEGGYAVAAQSMKSQS